MDEKKYDTLAETSVAFIPYMNPAVVLRSHIRSLVDECLKVIELKESEMKVLDEFNDGKDIGTDTIHIPPYHIEKTMLRFGNGKDRITTSVYQIRCNPAHATFFKVILCRMSNATEYPLHFYPEGAIHLDGSEKYRSILKEQNEYLFAMSTFPVFSVS